MKGLLTAIGVSLLLSPGAWAQGSSTTIEQSTTTTEPVERTIQIEKETVERVQPPPVERSSSSSSSSSYSSKTVKQDASAGAETKTTTTTKRSAPRHRKLGFRLFRSKSKSVPPKSSYYEKTESQSSHSEQSSSVAPPQ